MELPDDVDYGGVDLFVALVTFKLLNLFLICTCNSITGYQKIYRAKLLTFIDSNTYLKTMSMSQINDTITVKLMEGLSEAEFTNVKDSFNRVDIGLTGNRDPEFPAFDNTFSSYLIKSPYAHPSFKDESTRYIFLLEQIALELGLRFSGINESTELMTFVINESNAKSPYSNSKIRIYQVHSKKNLLNLVRFAINGTNNKYPSELNKNNLDNELILRNLMLDLIELDMYNEADDLLSGYLDENNDILNDYKQGVGGHSSGSFDYIKFLSKKLNPLTELLPVGITDLPAPLPIEYLKRLVLLKQKQPSNFQLKKHLMQNSTCFSEEMNSYLMVDTTYDMDTLIIYYTFLCLLELKSMMEYTGMSSRAINFRMHQLQLECKLLTNSKEELSVFSSRPGHVEALFSKFIKEFTIDLTNSPEFRSDLDILAKKHKRTYGTQIIENIKEFDFEIGKIAREHMTPSKKTAKKTVFSESLQLKKKYYNREIGAKRMNDVNLGNIDTIMGEIGVAITKLGDSNVSDQASQQSKMNINVLLNYFLQFFTDLNEKGSRWWEDSDIFNKYEDEDEDEDDNIIYNARMKELIFEVFKFEDPSQAFSLDAIRAIHKYVSHNARQFQEVYVIDNLMSHLD